MSNINFTISVQKYSNQIVGSTEDKFSEIKNGSLIQINDENYLYSAIGKETYNYSNIFSIQDNKTIIIKDSNCKLQKEDILTISFDEYEAKIISNIYKRGIKYKVGDIIGIEGGVVSLDITNGKYSPVLLNVSKIQKNGEVENLDFIENGKYIEPPQNPIKVYNGSGNGLELEIKFVKIPIESKIIRKINDIHNINNETIIFLNHNLPPNIKNGRINISKTLLNLFESYKGETRQNCEYKIFNHFTPNYNWPLMLKNTLSPDVIFNKCIIEMDKKVKELENKINQIGSK